MSKINTRRHGYKKKKTNRQTKVHKTHHRKLKTEQQESRKIWW